MRAIGVLAPKRNSMHGSAKYSTKAFMAGIASSANQPRRVATKPARTSAKNGKVTLTMFSIRSNREATRK